MRILVVGGGGREHALVRGLLGSKGVSAVFCAPGNAGTGKVATNLPIKADDIDGLIKSATKNAIDFTVVGPEAPLCAGIVDRFQKAGLRIFGPNAAAARIEGDKGYAKHLMKSAHVPTAEGRVFDDYEAARDFVATRDTGVVVKAAGLASGKGVFVCEDPADGLIALERTMMHRMFGEAGDTVVVEELLKGPELSVFALVSGQTIFVLETAQDYKRIGDGDTGANTGGMGAISPGPAGTADVMLKIERDILVPVVDAMQNDDAPYCGLLYAGIMLTPGGPKALEFNCRFGDPETQAVLMRLESDLAELLLATVEGRLSEVDVRWTPKAAVTVVMASRGYPEKFGTGAVIEGLGEVSDMEDVAVFHAATSRVEDLTVTTGGRVLSVTGLGGDLASARQRAYGAVERIHFENAYYRRDIGLHR